MAYQGPDQLHIGNGEGLKIHSLGSNIITSSYYPLKLNSIFYVPKIKRNLLSVQKLTSDNNVFCEFHSSYCLVKDKTTNRILLQGTLRNGLYYIELVNNKAATFLGVNNRLGHPQFKILKHTIEKFGLPTTQLPKSYICESCCLSKAHKLPFSASSQTSNKPLELVHSNLWGPAPVTSHFSFQYYVIFIDDYNKFTWFYPLKRKSDVLETFIAFHH